MKTLLTLIGFFICCSTMGQVGINNTDPKTTLQVDGLPADATKADGFMAPRLTLQQLNAKDNAYQAAQIGAIVYVTDISGNTTSKTVQVTTLGYYYYNGTIWKSMEERTGTVIFTGLLGTGAGGQVNATIQPRVFATVPLNATKNLGGGVWNSTNNTYAVPVSGTYVIKSTIRLTDNSDSRSIFQAVGIANVDIPDGIWQRNPSKQGVGLERWTMLYSRIAYFEKGDLLRLYIYSDELLANLSDASLNIALLSQN